MGFADSLLPEFDQVLFTSPRGSSIRSTPFSATRVEEFALSDVGVLQVLPDRDSDGDTHYSLRLLLKDGREVPLHAQPAYGKEWVDARATRIRDYLARSLGP